MNTFYANYFRAWTTTNGCTLTPIADARPSNFGEQLLVQFKQYARITYSNDDTLLPSFIETAIMTLEQSLEFPILPRSFSWNVGENTNYEQYEVPFRNCAIVGDIYDFEPSRAMVLIASPPSWPIDCVVGYDDAALIPQDLLITIFAFASSVEQGRSASDLSMMPIPYNIVSRYGVLRC